MLCISTLMHNWHAQAYMTEETDSSGLDIECDWICKTGLI